MNIHKEGFPTQNFDKNMESLDRVDKNVFMQLIRLLKEEKITDLVEECRDYFDRKPHQRWIVHQLYNFLQLRLGYSASSRELAKIFVNASDKLLNIGKEHYGLPPMFDCYWALGRVGELVDQTANINLMTRLGKNSEKPVMYIDSEDNIANSGFRPYLEDTFSIINCSKEKFHVNEIASLAPYSTFFYNYSETQYGHNSTFFGSSNTWTVL